jgi:hypothetical protein
VSEGLAGDLAQQESIVAMHLMAIASSSLRWISANADTPEVQGILYLDSTKSMHVLTGLDQKILTKLALEAGNVFEKLEIIKGFEQRKILEQELSLAQETQKAFFLTACRTGRIFEFTLTISRRATWEVTSTTF